MRGSAAASEIRVYIQDDNHDKENVDQYQFLGNCAPTPPLTQHFIISK